MNEKTLSIIVKAQDRASKVFDTIGSRVSAASMKIARAATVGLAAATTATVGLGVAAIKSAGEYEQSRVAFETMLGSADKARKMMIQIAAFAKSTPFELPEVVAGTKQLLAFGFEQKQLIPTMRKLGDIASGVGVPIGQLTNVYGQVRVAGRLMGQDLLQFTNAGVPLIEALAKTMKKPQSEIKKLVEQGKIGFPEVEKAIDSLTNKGSKFGGMMDKQSHTFAGVVSNIKDAFGQMLRSAVGIDVAGDIVAGSFFDRIKKAAEKAMPALQNFSTKVGPAVQDALKKFDQIMPKITAFIGGVISIAKAIAAYLEPKLAALINALIKLAPYLAQIAQTALLPLANIFGRVLVAAIGFAIDALRVLIQVISPVISWLSSNKAAVIALTAAIATFYTLMGATAAFSAISTALMALRMGFVGTTIATLGMRVGLQALLTTFITSAAIMSGPLTVAIAGVSILAAALSFQWMKNKTDADRLHTAQQNLRDSTDALKRSQDALRQSELAQQGASLAVEQAQRSYNQAVQQFGSRSLEARQALYNLKVAQQDLKTAQDRTMASMDAMVKKQNEVASNKRLVSMLSSVRNTLDGVTRSANGAVVSINRLITKTPSVNAVGQKINLAPLLKPGHNATGTSNWRGGLTWVGERGPELVNLPKGSKVMSNQESQKVTSGDIFNMYGNIVLSSADSVDRYFDRINAQREMAALGVGV